MKITTLATLAFFGAFASSEPQDLPIPIAESENQSSVPALIQEPAAEALALPSLGPLTARTADDSFFEVSQVRSARRFTPAETRNVFLFLDEQVNDMPLDELMEARERREAEHLASGDLMATGSIDPEIARARELARARIEQAMKRLDDSNLSAVLIAADGGSAILDGRVVRCGTAPFGEGLLLVRVGKDGAIFECEGRNLVVPFAGPGRRSGSTNTVDASGKIAPESTVDGTPDEIRNIGHTEPKEDEG